jgi:hypothetical protein
MSGTRGISLRPSSAVRERRLLALLQEKGRSPEDRSLVEAVEDAQLLGSLELAGIPVSWEEVRASRSGARARGEIAALRRARAAVDPGAPLTIAALLAWHAAIAGPIGLRRTAPPEDARGGAPAERIEGRLALLEDWLAAESARELAPQRQAALALARLVEIRPFDEANGRVSRLAASHLMVRGGTRPPILVGADGPRLLDALRAAFRFETAPLAVLLDEASERALDVMIQALERRLV